MRCLSLAASAVALALFVSLGVADEKEQPKELNKELLETCWKDLAGDNAELAWDRIVLMRRFSKQSVPFLIEKIKPATPPDMTKIEKLIKQLEDEDFQKRQDAEKELEKYGSMAEKPLRERLKGQLDSVNLRRAIERILDKLDGKQLPPDDLRIVRAFEVLEYVDEEAAVTHIQALAKGADGACVTREAKETLDRLTKRGKVK